MSSTRMPYAIASPPICSRPEPTCGPSRCCSDTVTWRRPRSICISPSGISAQPPVRWTHSRLTHKENRPGTHEPASPGDGRYRALCRAVFSPTGVSAGSAGNTRRSCWRSRVAAPLRWVAIATAVPAAGIPPSRTTHVVTATVPSARATRANTGLRRVNGSFCLHPTCTSSLRYRVKLPRWPCRTSR